jgi:hypothetical protein
MVQPLRGGALSAVPHELAGQIAAALETTAGVLAADVEGCEQLVASLPPTPGISHSFNELKRRAELIAIAHAYFREMAEHKETPVDIDDFAVRPLPSTR